MPKAVVNRPKTNHGANALFAKGGIMATKKFVPFEKSKKDKDTKSVFKKFGAEGSKKEEAFDAMQAKGMACGGKVKKMARGGGVESKGKTRGRFV